MSVNVSVSVPSSVDSETIYKVNLVAEVLVNEMVVVSPSVSTTFTLYSVDVFTGSVMVSPSSASPALKLADLVYTDSTSYVFVTLSPVKA